ncbi:cell division protein Fic [Gemmatimonadetes bacterium T265]|nr:cell division protein Fic [Gemmatimonadetes bacterium T265]
MIRQQAGPEGYTAFVPAPLPPVPPLDFGGVLLERLEAASHALGRLDGISASLDPDLLLYAYVRKEAVLSSQIEGTQSTLSDLLQYENAAAPGIPVDDVQEVSRYVQALMFGHERIRAGVPVSLRLIRDIHRVLMAGGRGSAQTPGEFRRTQNWIGGSRPGNARFVPPPPHEMLRALGDLEMFIHAPGTRPIVKAGLVHVQFETIHPFLDGNGRLGRLLITFLLCAESALSQPFLYLSLYFKQHRELYYDALQRVRAEGDWEGWLDFYLTGVEQTANQASRTTSDLRALFEADRQRTLAVGKSALSTHRVYEHLRQRVIVSIGRTAEALDLSVPTVTSALGRLEALGIAREATGRTYGRLYVYDRQLEILNRTEFDPPPVAEPRSAFEAADFAADDEASRSHG